MTNKEYNDYVNKRSARSNSFSNCLKAFFVGGTICTIGEILSELFVYIGADKEESLIYASLSLILLSGILTAIGIFDKIAKFGGGGALVPITGFANSVAAPSIEAKSEGLITGVASKMFTIAGPVIVFGTTASIIYGLLYYIIVIWR